MALHAGDRHAEQRRRLPRPVARSEEPGAGAACGVGRQPVPLCPDGGGVDWDGNELLLSDILGTEEDVIYRDIEDEVEKKLLKKAIDRLGERERMIIDLRFGLSSPDDTEMTQKEVADLMGISQSYISRLEKKIIKSQ